MEEHRGANYEAVIYVAPAISIGSVQVYTVNPLSEVFLCPVCAKNWLTVQYHHIEKQRPCQYTCKMVPCQDHGDGTLFTALGSVKFKEFLTAHPRYVMGEIILWRDANDYHKHTRNPAY